jgi:hypothetical protein
VVPDYEQFIRAERAKAKKEEEEKLQKEAVRANIRSRGADIGSSAYGRDDKIGRVDGLSSVMGQS